MVARGRRSKFTLRFGRDSRPARFGCELHLSRIGFRQGTRAERPSLVLFTLGCLQSLCFTMKDSRPGYLLQVTTRARAEHLRQPRLQPRAGRMGMLWIVKIPVSDSNLTVNPNWKTAQGAASLFLGHPCPLRGRGVSRQVHVAQDRSRMPVSRH